MESTRLGFGLLVMTPPFAGVEHAQWLKALAQAIDGNGFDAMFAVDHIHLAGDRYLADPRDIDRPFQWECWTTLATIAAVTERLRVGPLVTPLPLRHPVLVAKMAATIDQFSDGRLILALGTGWKGVEYTTYNLPYEPTFKARFAALREGVEVVRALWTTDGPVDYMGEHYRLEAAAFYPKPVAEPTPPIWFGGAGPSALDLVARLGDGWTPAAPHYDAVSPEVYRDGLAKIRELAVGYGRDPWAITPAFLLNTAIARDRSAAWDAAEAQHLRDDWKDTPIEQMRSSGVLAVGTPDDCIDHLKRYYAAGVRFFTVCPVPMTMDAAWRTAELYQERVIPALREWAEETHGTTS